MRPLEFAASKGRILSIPDFVTRCNRTSVASGPYVIGNVVYANKPLYPFGLREDEIIQHVAIFGRSGAGKTNTMFQLIDNFLEHKKPFLIFDWKRNYRDMLAVRDEEILVYTVGRDTAPLVFNPLIPPEDTDAAVWLKKLIEIIAHSYYLGEGVMYLLQEAIHAVYIEHGVYSRNPQRYLPGLVVSCGECTRSDEAMTITRIHVDEQGESHFGE